MTHKTCPHCHTTKPLTEYPRDRSQPSGYDSWCKPCKRESVNMCNQRRRQKLRPIKQRVQRKQIPVRQCNVCGKPSDTPLCHEHNCGYNCDYCRYNDWCVERVNCGLHVLCEFPDNNDIMREAALELRSEDWLPVVQGIQIDQLVMLEVMG